MQRWSVETGDSLTWLRSLPDDSVHSWITSPPYWGLRDYGVSGQIGLEPTPEAFVAKLVAVFAEARRVLHPGGTLWLNMGGGYRDKQLDGMPWKLAFALQNDGWLLRADVIWSKPNAMPESVRDRPSKSHEYLFLLTKSPRYYYDGEAVRRKSITNDGRKPYGSTGAWQMDGRDKYEQGAGKPQNRDAGKASLRSVWTIPVGRYKGAHFATFPRKLVEPCVKAGTSEKGCCPACLAPWLRIVERQRIATRPGLNNKQEWRGDQADPIAQRSATSPNRDRQRHIGLSNTVGWAPGCQCGHVPIPCTVGDMFAGSGTTLAVAVELGRQAIGCELNETYVTLINDRMKGVIPALF